MKFILCTACALLSVASICTAQEALLSDAEQTQRYIEQREAEFSSCTQSLKKRAVSEGIPEYAAITVFDNLKFLPRIIELDRTQAEFTRTFQEYIDARVTEARVENGRKMLNKHRSFLTELTKEFGVPGQYLIAFWGLETNYGSFKGNTSTFDALATLGCDRRRSEFFSGELMAAVRLMVDNDLPVDLFKGSWAGALGHTQFMPSNYARYAVDGDADGKIDLWNSERDALRSAANFLSQLGWKPGERWGREVRLPSNFDYSIAGLSKAKTLSSWAASGLTTADGERLPSVKIDASILVPQGHQGPAFAAYSNFDVIMRWNRSQSYAIAVGHLADRIAGAGRLRQSAPDNGPKLSRDLVTQVQIKLQMLGFDPGGIDGVFGGGTKRALAMYQQDSGLIPDGFLDLPTLNMLLAR